MNGFSFITITSITQQFSCHETTYIVVHLVLSSPKLMGPRLAQRDPGANVDATPDLSHLINPTKIVQTIQIDSANQEADFMLTTQLGWFNLSLADGSSTKILMSYCQQVTNTIISHQDFTHLRLTY